MLDLAFAMDCTASMGPYIIEARDNVIQIVNEIVESEDCNVRLALVEYRDHPPVEESFITQIHDFTETPGVMKNWLRNCSAGGGGDIPEAVPDALNEVLKLSWRKQATKICVLITDAPPHGLGAYRDKFPEGCPLGLDPMEICKDLTKKGVTLYVAGCEPSILAYKHFYLAIAHLTGGQYVPLEEAQGLVKIITIGAREEMSLKKFETEVEKEITLRAASGRVINEEELASMLHTRWEQRGETTRQLTLNQRVLETAANSKTAMSITKMGFDGVKTLYKTTTPQSRKGEDVEEKEKATDNNNQNTELTELNRKEMDKMVEKATRDLPDLPTLGMTGKSIKVNMRSIMDSGQVDFGPASETMAQQPSVPKKKVDLSKIMGSGPDAKGRQGNLTGTKGNFQCIDGKVSFSQTMRLIQKSVIKMSSIDPVHE